MHKIPVRHTSVVSASAIAFWFIFALANPVIDALVFRSSAIAQSIVPAPDGTGTVVRQQGDRMDIQGGTQSGANLFHSFQQFGLTSGQIANFLANPNIQNILSRVTGGEASIINGQIQVSGSNANLYLMNPAGIVFGANASLNVPASFTATTASGIGLNGSWFNAFTANDYTKLDGTPTHLAFTLASSGAIVNQGTLAVPMGQSIQLVGGSIVNTGTLLAPAGAITIAAVPGEKLVRLSQPGSLLSIEIAPFDQSGNLRNQGAPTALSIPSVITPLSLPTLLTGDNLNGATGVNIENGVVRLTSANHTLTADAGTAIVSGHVSTVNGSSTPVPSAPINQIAILGDRVTLTNANIDASGRIGGTILIGGDYQGKRTVPTAQFTQVDASTVIRADALLPSALLPVLSADLSAAAPSAGRVIIWADDTTRFAGSIFARGTALPNSQGGLVETSGGKQLAIAPSARVDTSAVNGQVGMWLLDPAALEVVNMGGAAAISGGNNAPTTAATVDAGAIVAALNSTNVNLQATNSITVNAAIDATNNSTSQSLLFTSPLVNLNAAIALKPGAILSGTANTVNVGAAGEVQNGVDVAAAGGTVNLAPTTYLIPDTVKIAKDLTLQGTDPANTIISGGNRVGVLEIGNGAIALQNLTITHGQAASATANTGAGILYNGSGSLTIRNSAITNNRASSIGGGINKTLSSTLTLIDTTVSANSASDGGGIYARLGTTNILNSTISYNTATSGGGGIRNAGSGFVGNSQLNITNSTISGNRANQDGGGIENGAATLTILNSTIANNIADLNNGNAGNGGGIAQTSNTGVINLQNSIVAGNVDASPTGGMIHPDVSGIFNNLGNSLIGINAGSPSFVNGTNGNRVGTIAAPLDPKLAPLADYGGSTQTHALLPDSPALNAAASVALVTIDQRGIARPQFGISDIGAFESAGYTIAPLSGSGQSTAPNTMFGTVLQVRLTENGFNAPIPGASVTFTVPSRGASGTANITTMTTSATGIAFTRVSANAIAGSYTVLSSIPGLTPAATFKLTNLTTLSTATQSVPSAPKLTFRLVDQWLSHPAIAKLKWTTSIANLAPINPTPINPTPILCAVRAQRRLEIDEFLGLPDCAVVQGEQL
jgi:filamentous hemagglutinin family protein